MSTLGKTRARPDPGRILNYSTEIKAERSIDEIKAILRAHKANSVTEIYAAGHVSAIEFVFETGWGARPFVLPAKPDVVLQLMVERRNKGKSVWDRFYLDGPWQTGHVRIDHAIPESMREQAERTAWRTIKDWIEAQMALLATRQVSFEQIFLPYALVDDTRTMFDVYSESQLRLGDGRA